jgi:geranylgeranyl diphosphate synthase type II
VNCVLVSDLNAYLADCRLLALEEIRRIIPHDQHYRAILYDLMLDYPLRAAKGLRPALCIATCRALGGSLEEVLPSAAVLELYHNAFLIHDDVEDGSAIRRDRPTLHRAYGVPIAVNVGDAMLGLALRPLLDNMRLIGMGKALRILQVVARMVRESSEGQALELAWIRDRRWELSDASYMRMVYKKTSWYTFITPVMIGSIIAGLAPERAWTLRVFAALLGIAFQIQDDILNLTTEAVQYGKDVVGDLWEGKHTLIVMHMMRVASRSDRELARSILTKPRPDVGACAAPPTQLSPVLAKLMASRDLTEEGLKTIEHTLTQAASGISATKTETEIHLLRAVIDRCGSIDYARRVAGRLAFRAEAVLARARWLQASVHREFLSGLVDFVVNRDR